MEVMEGRHHSGEGSGEREAGQEASFSSFKEELGYYAADFDFIYLFIFVGGEDMELSRKRLLLDAN